MKKTDCIAAAATFLCIAYFIFSPSALDTFIYLTGSYPYLMSFFKFALLATFGECIGLRITSGVYNKRGFGILPRAFVWGCLGLGIKAAFTIFAVGVPMAVREIGINLPPRALADGPFLWTCLAAVCVSTALNTLFAPMLMLAHKVTDSHIEATGGTLSGFFSRIDVARHLAAVNWAAFWGFLMKKTIPYFWIPMHTITFLLPQSFQVLFAALLGIVLGTILAFAARRRTA